MVLLNDANLHSNFFDTLFRFRVIHYFVGLVDDVILFAQSQESIQVDYASKDKSNQKKLFQIACLSEHHINSLDISNLICVAKLQGSLHA